ncbi:unnamed protein product [Prorocentrum cordatum]|uniref:Uncharacterized protein n=1 Tax=Prorocentrum cordatum TaxID=2364126 RepID=A0ABN9RV62_9DINO|nr:unnamed protein product [Polarella glacialis]|mmetsp:Transcript_130265/g.353495  ORF Transcript_130265/g.353495 Transcript_130265/m.353495 type:complete len:138 (-) Transcript_130265:479-892(-)
MSQRPKKRPAAATSRGPAAKKAKAVATDKRQTSATMSEAIVRLFCADRNIRGKVLHYGAHKSWAQQRKVFDEVCDEAAKLVIEQDRVKSIEYDVGSFDAACDIASDVLDSDDLYMGRGGPEIIPWRQVVLRQFHGRF